jgi:hypothetical protein
MINKREVFVIHFRALERITRFITDRYNNHEKCDVRDMIAFAELAHADSLSRSIIIPPAATLCGGLPQLDPHFVRDLGPTPT